MTVEQLIAAEVKRIPEQLRREVLDFIRFLETKTIEEKTQTLIASESSLKKDWLKPEEDEAWKDL